MSKQTTRRASAHRAIQISNLMEIASSNRVSFYCRAIKAASIGNNSAAGYFTSKAARFERIRQTCARRLLV